MTISSHKCLKLSGTQKSLIRNTGAQKRILSLYLDQLGTKWWGRVREGSGGRDGGEGGKRGREKEGREAGKEWMGRWIDMTMAGAKRILIL